MPKTNTLHMYERFMNKHRLFIGYLFGWLHTMGMHTFTRSCVFIGYLLGMHNELFDERAMFGCLARQTVACLNLCDASHIVYCVPVAVTERRKELASQSRSRNKGHYRSIVMAIRWNHTEQQRLPAGKDTHFIGKPHFYDENFFRFKSNYGPTECDSFHGRNLHSIETIELLTLVARPPFIPSRRIVEFFRFTHSPGTESGPW